MPNHVLQFDCHFSSGDIELDLTSAPYSGAVSEIWAEWDIAFNSTYVTAVLAQPYSQTYNDCYDSGISTNADITLQPISSVLKWVAELDGAPFPPNTPYAPSPAITDNQFYRIKFHMIAGSPPTFEVWIDGVSIGTIDTTGATKSDIAAWDLRANGLSAVGALVYVDNFKLGTTEGGSDLASDDFESGGSSPSAAIWNSSISGSSTIITDPGIAPPVSPPPEDSATVSGITTPIFVEEDADFSVIAGKTSVGSVDASAWLDSSVVGSTTSLSATEVTTTEILVVTEAYTGLAVGDTVNFVVSSTTTTTTSITDAPPPPPTDIVYGVSITTTDYNNQSWIVAYSYNSGAATTAGTVASFDGDNGLIAVA